MPKRSKIHIGTSGWRYDHWVGPFYPSGLSGDEFLEHYAKSFRTVEINNSFYHMPEKKTMRRWSRTVPDGFIFAVKASRYITHMKKLKDPRKPVSKLLKTADALGDKLGPILFQLPPKWRVNRERLESFLESLPSGYRYAFELRDPSWFDDDVYAILEKHGAAFCIFEIGGLRSPEVVTSGMVYVRLHGPGAAYKGQYSKDALSEWAHRIRKWRRRGKEVFFYFDNDEAGYAPEDAKKLSEMRKS